MGFMYKKEKITFPRNIKAWVSRMPYMEKVTLMGKIREVENQMNVKRLNEERTLRQEVQGVKLEKKDLDTSEIETDDPIIESRIESFKEISRRLKDHMETMGNATKGNDTRTNIYIRKLNLLSKKDFGLDMPAYLEHQKYIQELKEELKLCENDESQNDRYLYPKGVRHLQSFQDYAEKFPTSNIGNYIDAVTKECTFEDFLEMYKASLVEMLDQLYAVKIKMKTLEETMNEKLLGHEPHFETPVLKEFPQTYIRPPKFWWRFPPVTVVKPLRKAWANLSPQGMANFVREQTAELPLLIEDLLDSVLLSEDPEKYQKYVGKNIEEPSDFEDSPEKKYVPGEEAVNEPLRKAVKKNKEESTYKKKETRGDKESKVEGAEASEQKDNAGAKASPDVKEDEVAEEKKVEEKKKKKKKKKKLWLETGLLKTQKKKEQQP
eukprot:TRINITY_DN12936_c0_g2_i1.p1 TRINITY_DN12936_c0_g2~~TRINITY_DN12936_c0_g2_i1.p1  ORF type:complete len:435 (+),score=126.32 TRINITY_DN12936_c0_g2_i1:162-1466(+)